MDLQRILQSAVQAHSQGKLAEAERLYQQVLAREPHHAGVLQNLGVLAGQQERNEAAREYFLRSIAASPGDYRFRNNLGTLYIKTRKFAEAEAVFRKAIELGPEVAENHRNLGVALAEQGRLEEALASYQKAGKLRGNWGQLELNLATLYREKGEIEEALRHAELAIAAQADLAEAHFFMANCLLLLGKYREAWGEYEWRWKCKGYPPVRKEFSTPRWDGGDVRGKTVLLYSEQGFGDEIQFVRFAPRVADLGARVIVESSGPLVELFRSLDERVEIVERGRGIPKHDLNLPLLSVGGVLGARVETVGTKMPYLFADEKKVARWRGGIGAEGLKVGVNWTGSRAHLNDRARSVAVEKLAVLGDVAGVRLVSLQKGESAGAGMMDLGAELKDFSETAAAMMALDLVITVDTSVAHLAGALGKTCWTLIAKSGDWRWLMDREDSPWYPTMRLFRQKTAGDWDEVIGRVTACLKEWQLSS